MGRSGFHLNIVTRRDDSRVECYIDFGKNSDETNLAVFKMLEQQKGTIESTFGAPLDWQELQDSRACRICKEVQGGWGTSEDKWPELHERLIGAAIRLEKALKAPIQDVQLP